MHQYFPLTETLWIEWIQDEIAIAMEIEEKQHILNLFEKAIEDYLSIDIWFRYTNYMVEEYKAFVESPNESLKTMFNLEKVREIFHRAVNTTGYHYKLSHIIWNRFRDFEMEFLETEFSEKQYNRVKELYLKRINTPHAELENTFSQYSTFVTKYSNQNYEAEMVAANPIYTKAMGFCTQIELYEVALEQTANSLKSYQQYIEFLRKSKDLDVFYVKSMYERALQIHCLDPSLWDDYIVYLLGNFRIQNIVLKVCERSVRNCPWSGDLWSHFVRTTESFKGTEIDLNALVEKSLQSGSLQSNLEEFIKLCLTCCDFIRHRFQHHPDAEKLRSGFLYVSQMITNVFPDGDPYCRVEYNWINTETKVVKDIAKARKLWDSLIKRRGGESEIWLRYIEFEKHHDTVSKVQSIFKQAHLKQMDWPERIFEAWLAYEHEMGSVENFELAYTRISQQRKILQLKQEQAIQYEAEATIRESNKREKRLEKDREFRAKRRQKEKEKKSEKRKSEAVKEIQSHEDNAVDDSENPALKKQKLSKTRKDDFTVFISNLNPETDEVEIAEFFKDCGTVVDVRIVKDKDSISKGYAYIEFADEEQAQKAQAKDGQVLNGKEISAHVNPEKTADPKTIFVCNFSRNIEESAIQDLFKPFGEIEEIRMPLTKEGRSRCFAYVQFKHSESAEAAVSLDGQEFEPGKPLSVAISDPSKKKKPNPLHDDASPKTLFVANFPLKTTKEELQSLFQQYGNLQEVRIVSNQAGKSKGCGFVEYQDENCARAALSLNDYNYNGRHIAVSIADPEKSLEKKKEKKDNEEEKLKIESHSVYIKGLSDETTIVTLRAEFKKYGKIRNARLMPDKNAATVEYFEESDVGKAVLGLNDTMLDGQIIHVEPSNSDLAKLSNQMPKPSPAIPVPTALLPRRIQRPATKLTTQRFRPVAKMHPENPPTPASSTSTSAKSNTDFRDLFLASRKK
ncbi:Splicing factor, variant 2 [Basidiobolus ranarum]